MKRLPVSLIAYAVSALAQAGEHPCGQCHLAETRSQVKTSMALALQPALKSAIPKENPSMRVTSNGYTYVLRREEETLRYSVEGGGKTFSTVIP